MDSLSILKNRLPHVSIIQVIHLYSSNKERTLVTSVTVGNKRYLKQKDRKKKKTKKVN